MGTVQVEENFRAEPNGVLLGQIMAGTEVRSPRVDGQWVEVALEGWVWARSLQRGEAGAEDEVIVSAEGGENLREAPSGRVAARLGRGTVLRELERVPGWIRVRRLGWIWAPSVTLAQSSVPERPDARSDGAGAAAPSSDEPDASGAPLGWYRAGEAGTAVLGTPDGDTLAAALEGAELRMMSREGNWARVQLEGWVWVPGLASEGAEGDADGTVISTTASSLAEDPDRFRSRLVELELQFISIERAEKVRTDFYEGEPFLLARAMRGEGGFVYVALPSDRLPEVQGFMPLERIVVVGRVRTGSAGLTGSPILDLLEIRRVERRATGS